MSDYYDGPNGSGIVPFGRARANDVFAQLQAIAESFRKLPPADQLGFRKGDPGGNTSDVGTFEQAKTMKIPLVAQTIRLTDRGKAAFERYRGDADLPTAFPAAEDYWWFKDDLNQYWNAVAVDRGIELAALGATPDAATITPHLEQAKSYCVEFGHTAILLPIGAFKSTTQFLPGEGISIVGPGSGLCIIDRTVTNDGCFVLQGDGSTFSGFTLRDTVTTTRGNAMIQGHGVCVYLATNFKVDDVMIVGGAGAGILTLGSQRGTVTRSHVMGTKGDAIHTTGGFGDRASTDISVWGCTAINCGDDHFPVVSYQIDGARCARISFGQCYSLGGDARAFVSAGGDDITYANCIAVSPALAGIAVLTDGTSGGLHGNTRISFANCTVVNGGSASNSNPYGAIHVFALGGADAITITFTNCHVSGSRNEGLRAYSSAGGNIRGLVVSGGNIAGCYYAGVRTTGVIDQRILNVSIQQTRGEAILLELAKGNLRVVGNDWEAAGTAGTAECTITDGGLNGVKQVQYNSGRVGNPRGAEGLPSSDYIVALIDGLQTSGNYDEQGRLPKFGADGLARQVSVAAADPDSTATATGASTPPAAIGQAVSQSDYNALVGSHNALLADFNDLLGKMRAAGLVAR